MTRPLVAEGVPPRAAPPRRSRRGLATLAIIAVVAATAAGSALWASGALGGTGAAEGVRLEVWDQRAEQRLFVRDVEVGESFTLEHTHSVTERLVRETFSIQDGPVIALEELWFDQPGPNLPVGPERIGDTTTTFLREDGAFRVLHHGHPIGTVPLMVGSASVEHVLNFPDGERLRLLELSEPGTPVEVRVSGSDERGR